MTIRYAGPGGNDADAGTSWATRKLTLNGVEDTPVVAGDVIYVAPGVYRELLTVDVSGGAGSPITYIGDVSGEHTDGVGGVVRITGSNNDQAAARAYCINASAKNYRTFRGFHFDATTDNAINTTNGCTNWVNEDCTFSSSSAISLGGTASAWTIRRCVFIGSIANCILFTHVVPVDDTAHVIENCIFIAPRTYGIYDSQVGGITVRHCVFMCAVGLRVAVALSIGQTVTINNSIFYDCTTALQATALGEIVENYNTFFSNATDRATVNVGANSVAYPPLFSLPLLHAGAGQVSGLKYPWWFGELSEWSPVRRLAGTGMSATDLLGLTRPSTDAKKSWGAVQFQDVERDTATVRGGSAASLKLADAGEHQIFVPVSTVNTTIRVYVYREANYAGTNPRMVVKQPGQADITMTDTGAAGGWNLLTHTFTPAANPDYVIVALQSLNTAGAGNYATYFEDLSVS